MYHVWQVAPAIGDRVPGNRAGADCEVDIASGKYPPAIVGTGRGSGATRRQIGDSGVIPRIGIGIVAISLVRKRVAAGAIDVIT